MQGKLTNCVPTILLKQKGSSQSVLRLCDTVLKLRSNCSFIVQEGAHNLFYNCASSVLKLSSNCARTVLKFEIQLCSNRAGRSSQSVPQLCKLCAQTVLLPCSNCAEKSSQSCSTQPASSRTVPWQPHGKPGWTRSRIRTAWTALQLCTIKRKPTPFCRCGQATEGIGKVRQGLLWVVDSTCNP